MLLKKARPLGMTFYLTGQRILMVLADCNQSNHANWLSYSLKHYKAPPGVGDSS